MKIVKKLCVFFLVFLFVSGCEQPAKQPPSNGLELPEPLENNGSKENPQKIEVLNIPETLEKNDVEEKPNNIINAEPGILPEQTTVYRNEKLGFELTFPKSWLGWYVVYEEEDENAISVAFYGKSKMSNIDFEEYGIPGLHMFYIANETYIEEPSFLDNIMEIGIGRTGKLFYATRTDWPLGALADAGVISDEAESTLIELDYAKAIQMQNEIDDVINTFEAYK